jgi:predicted nucleic acid-binding protein
MSAEFVDTNILVYAHDTSAGKKHQISRDLIVRLFEEGTGALSVQILAEFYVVSRKVPLSPEKAEQIIVDLGSWKVHSPTHSDLITASVLHRRNQIAWWDSIVITSAQQLGCSVLWTEDLSDGQRFGSLTIRNPFRQS